MRALAVLAAVGFLAALGCAHGASGPAGFGLERARAVEVCLPPGEKAYLDSLRCADGSPPRARHAGNVGARTNAVDRDDPRLLLQMDPERPLGPGEPDFHIVEEVELRCPAASVAIYVDMYHCPARDQPPPEGFTK
jgi:hypothetical protein